jgi:NAD(P)-dependent dehydrogenase (short-subunit alcohol dehydrogenase family)
MNRHRIVIVLVVLLLGRGVTGQAPTENAGRIAGSWGANGRTLLELKTDAAGAVSGTAYFYGGNNRVVLPIESGRFDPVTGLVTLSGQTVPAGASTPTAWTIEGTLEGDTLRANYVFGSGRGTLTMTRLQAQASPAAAKNPPGTVLVTGSNRGLGLEFVSQYAALGWTVIATVRNPQTATELRAVAKQTGRVTIETLDMRDRPAIARLAAKYRGRPIDVLINNAGIGGDVKAQTLGSFDYATFEEAMAVNVYGPLAMAEAFRPNVAASRQKKIVSITSGWGVFSLPRPPGPYFYRASKAALNMAMHALATELREQGVIVGLVAPGAADTELRRQLQGDSNAPPPAEPVAAMIKIIDRLTLDNNDKPYNFDGTVLPW